MCPIELFFGSDELDGKDGGHNRHGQRSEKGPVIRPPSQLTYADDAIDGHNFIHNAIINCAHDIQNGVGHVLT